MEATITMFLVTALLVSVLVNALLACAMPVLLYLAWRAKDGWLHAEREAIANRQHVDELQLSVASVDDTLVRVCRHVGMEVKSSPEKG